MGKEDAQYLLPLESSGDGMGDDLLRVGVSFVLSLCQELGWHENCPK